jgi:hypothetical protein
MLIVGICDEGLGASPKTIAKYGDLLGLGATLAEVLAHALSRPESLAPARSGLEIHTGDAPYAALTTVSEGGARTLVFGDMPTEEGVERMINVSGAALFAIAHEIAGMSAVDVDTVLEGAAHVQKPSEAA